MPYVIESDEERVTIKCSNPTVTDLIEKLTAIKHLGFGNNIVCVRGKDGVSIHHISGLDTDDMFTEIVATP